MRVLRSPVAWMSVLAVAALLWLLGPSFRGQGDKARRVSPVGEQSVSAPHSAEQGSPEPQPRAVPAVAANSPTQKVTATGAIAASAIAGPVLVSAVVPAPDQANPGADPGDRYNKATVLKERVTTDPKQPGFRSRVRLIRSDFKYPLLRVEDKLAVDPATGADKVVEQKAMVADHIIVKLKKGFSEKDLAALLQPLGASIRRKMPASGVYIIEFPQADIDTVPQALEQFTGPQISVAEPDFIVHANVLPNDARFSELWGMNNLGQTGGIADADIDAPEAWDVAVNRGSHSVVVGVIDTGIDATHPDLISNLWTNPGEIAGNGLDDDNNGFIDDVRGWDFVNNDNNPHDDNKHGTHCSGTIGGAGNNAAGVTGVCWNVSLMGLKFLNASGSGAISDAVEATAYATLLGVDLTSNSWGGGGFSQLLKDEIDAAHAAGILFVAAAGNSSANNDTTPNYPSNYDSPNIIAVAATTHTDGLSDFSSYGATQVDLGAPGSGILSSVPGGGYSSFDGTSMATPHVAGACALLKAHKPSLSHVVIRELILGSTDLKPALIGKCATGGRLNVHQALILANDIAVTPIAPFVASGPSAGPFAPSSRSYTLTNNADLPQVWTAANIQPWLTLSASGGTLAPGASTTVTATLNSQASALPDGNHADTITFANTTSERSVMRTVSLLVGQPDYFTEQFDSTAHDLDNLRFVFVPEPSATAYFVTRAAAPAFNTDPAGGTPLALSDDASVEVILTGGAQVRLYGTAYSNFYVGSNGFITFGAPDFTYSESLSAHFSRPRVSAFFDDLLPNASSTISWRQLADRVAVTYQNVPEYGTNNPNNFQVELFFDGRIAITHHAIAAADGLVGLSRGTGVPANFVESDFSAYPVMQQFTVILPASASEGDGVLVGQGTVSVEPSPAADLTVSLSSSSLTDAAVPASVVIPAGGNSAAFDLTILDDAVLDGTQSANITAAAAGYLSGSAAIQVHDNESATLGLLLASTTAEGVASVQGTVTVTAAPARDVAVTLLSSDTTAAKVPLSVTIPAGQTSATFYLTPQEDIFYDGPQTAVITAEVTGWTSGTASIVVEDNEIKSLALTVPPNAIEGAVGITGTISIPGALPINLTVTLESSNPAEITVPQTVQINAGQMQVTFPITVLNDTIDDGSQVVTINATSTGFIPASAAITVVDNDPNHFTIVTSAGPQIRGGAFAVTVTARRADGSVLETFSGSATLTGAGTAGAVAVTPATLTGFVNGVWTGNVTVATADTAVVLQVSDGQNHTGSSDPFDVPAVGPLHHFAWAPIRSPQEPGVPFGVTVEARDRIENTVTDFAGAVALSGVASAGTTNIGAGTGTTINYPFYTEYHDQRTQIIYTAAELGGAKPLVSLAFDVSTLPGQAMNSFTIRLRHTTKTSFSGAGNATWESTGWTTVYQAAQTITTTGWNTFAFPVPFLYDGTSNLMVDISFNNASYTTSGGVRVTPSSDARVMSARADSDSGDPLNWSGAVPIGTTSPFVPNVRFGTAVPVAVTPTVSGNFTAGVWNGSVSVPQEAAAVSLQATATGGTFGLSKMFTVREIPVAAFAPNGLTFILPLGSSAAKSLTITNGGAGVLNWALTPGGGQTSVSGTDGDENKPGALAAGLPAILGSLDAGHASITSRVANRFDFGEGVTGTSIGDGGNDLYDGGNILNTNLGTALSYSNGVIAASPKLGSGGQYFTRKHPGLFVFAADVAGLSHFEITGNLGADGAGGTDTAVLTMIRGGMNYKGFVKRVFGADGDPSVNHLIIVPDNGSVSHNASANTDNDQHRVTGLAGVTRLYYLLYSRANGGYIDNTATTSIMAAFLDAIGEADWAVFSPASGTVMPGGSKVVEVTAFAQTLPIGAHSRSIVLSSNDPSTPQLLVPVTLEVVAAGDSDGDLLPDFWEARYGWSAGDAALTHGRDGDPDQDGISNWMEYLLDLNPTVADTAQMPCCAVQVNPADGLRYLTFAYRRRTDAPSLAYAVQVSSDMSSWESGPTLTEEISATPNAGGDSETVVARIKPPLGTPGHDRKFVKVEIIAP